MTRRHRSGGARAAPSSQHTAGPLGWRWRNVPVPEAHLGVGAVGLLMTVRRPRLIAWPAAPRIGWPLIAGGVALAAWATRAAGATDLARPDRLVTSGPYGRSRHPMYVAWTAIFLGLACVIRTAWLVRLMPLLAVLIHRETRREEERLADAFGTSYHAYQARVRRYM